ncbi:hypothetical protein KY326_01690 [Candidatus Woesearchaeota archaeon]|nr:hypothetical protein [Candidatus Woesearchaeota archaeon]
MDAEKRYIYYKTTTKIVLPENPAWRFWKFKMPNGEWRYFRGIKNIKELRDLLVKFNPEAFYYSTSLFLNTDHVEEANYVIADQCFLNNQYFVVDIDNRNGTEEVKKSAMEVMHRMAKFQDMYEFERPIFTVRGVRLEFKDKIPRPELLPNQKEDWVKKARKEFCLTNLEDIGDVDHVIAWDTRRVIKCIGSPNPHNEFTTQVIASPAYLPAIPGKLQVNETKGQKSFLSLHEQGSRPDQELGSSPPYPLYFGKFIRNKVEGTKDRFVPYFEYNKKYKHWYDDLVFLQRKYGLSTIYIVDDYLKVLCIGIDAIPAPRLDKIYNQSESNSKSLWRKFHNLYIRTSSFFNRDLKKITQHDLKPLFRVDNSEHRLFPISKPHLDFISHMGCNTDFLIERDIIGNEKNKVYQAFFENRRMDKV